MRRVYIDTNTFTRMEAKEGEKYVQLENYLRSNSCHFFFPYSQAHIDDLSNDPTEHKNSDLDFIETFSSVHFMTHHHQEGLKYNLASPKEAMDSKLVNNEPFDFSQLLSELENDEDPMIQSLGLLLKPLINQQVHNIEMDISKLRTQDLEMLNKVVPGLNQSFSVSDMFTHMQKLNEDLSDKKKFKVFRKYNLDNLPGFNSIKDVSLASINNALVKSQINKTLSDLIDEHSNGKEVSVNQKFISGFIILNFFGLDQESNKKANFVSLSNDAQHAYYAGYCDIFISEDEGLRTKAKILYDNYGFTTSIFSVEDFLTNGQIINDGKVSQMDFINKLNEDITPEHLLQTFESSQFNRLTSIYSAKQSYFNYFDLIEYIDDQDTGKAIVLRPKNEYGHFYDEVKLITNKVIASFGMDAEKLGEFSDGDLKAIKNGKWEGRIWALPSAYVNLEINTGTKQLCLCVLFKNPQKNIA